MAFSQLEGLSETDQDGRHKGMIVDYLDEIAKYTGWEYEYIPVENDDIISNFLEGQYDLMGGTFYSPGFEEYFAYPDYNTGRSRAVLLCRRDDGRLLGYDLTTLNAKTIGVYDRAVDKIRHLNEFLTSNDLECGLKYYTCLLYTSQGLEKRPGPGAALQLLREQRPVLHTAVNVAKHG